MAETARVPVITNPLCQASGRAFVHVRASALSINTDN